MFRQILIRPDFKLKKISSWTYHWATSFHDEIQKNDAIENKINLFNSEYARSSR